MMTNILHNIKKNITSNIYNIYLLLMSFFILGLFIHFRLFTKRAEYSLILLKNSVDFYYFCLCFFFAFLHLLTIILILHFLSKKKKTNNKIILIFKNFIEIVLWKPLDYLLKTISPYIPYSGTIIIYYCEFFQKTSLRINIMKFFTLLFYFLPRILMSCLFFVELLFYNRLQLFITFFFVLLIPIIYILFINVCEHFFSNNMISVLEGLNVEYKGPKTDNGVYMAHEFSLKTNMGFSQEDLSSLIENWTFLFYLDNLNKITRNFIQKYSPYITLLTSTLYLISFSYKIYYLFIL